MIIEKIIAVLQKDAITAVRYRNGFVLSSLAHAAQLATFYYLARAIGPQFRPEGMPYFLFLLIGTGFYTFLLSGTHSFLKTIQESQQTGTLEVLLTTATPAAVLVSLGALSAFGESLLQFVVYIGAGIFLFAPILNISVAGCLLAFGFSILSAFAIGLFAAGMQISMHKGSAVLWVLGSGAWLMSGTLFPVTALPKPVQMVSYVIPFTHSLAAMRLAVLGGSFAAIAREVGILALFALFLVPAGVMFFSSMVRKARQKGTLSFY
jgi:ABC-type polysaccharide/polyol phosphate export permease